MLWTRVRALFSSAYFIEIKFQFNEEEKKTPNDFFRNYFSAAVHAGPATPIMHSGVFCVALDSRAIEFHPEWVHENSDSVEWSGLHLVPRFFLLLSHDIRHITVPRTHVCPLFILCGSREAFNDSKRTQATRTHIASIFTHFMMDFFAINYVTLDGGHWNGNGRFFLTFSLRIVFNH